MSIIKNTPIKNVFGDGYEQEITLDNGEKYTIRNTPAKNVFGDGYQKEIIKNKDYGNTSFSEFIGELIGLVIAGLILWGLFNWLC